MKRAVALAVFRFSRHTVVPIVAVMGAGTTKMGTPFRAALRRVMKRVGLVLIVAWAGVVAGLSGMLLTRNVFGLSVAILAAAGVVGHGFAVCGWLRSRKLLWSDWFSIVGYLLATTWFVLIAIPNMLLNFPPGLAALMVIWYALILALFFRIRRMRRRTLSALP